GEEIVVTAQVHGQRAAINQQFAALTVKNVVSTEKIEELRGYEEKTTLPRHTRCNTTN
ncbi:unnamed protein product, partial [marine sediment metagenome]